MQRKPPAAGLQAQARHALTGVFGRSTRIGEQLKRGDLCKIQDGDDGANLPGQSNDSDPPTPRNFRSLID